jgi:hypothetical protein
VVGFDTRRNDYDLRTRYSKLGGDPFARKLRVSQNSLSAKQAERASGAMSGRIGVAAEGRRYIGGNRVLISNDHVCR